MNEVQGEGLADDFRLSPWNHEGIAAIEAVGADIHTALASLLHAVLALAAAEPVPPSNPFETRAAPIRGEGDDLPSLVADLTEDLLAQIDEAGTGSLAVALDGVVRRDDGGFVAWGYLETAAQAADRVPLVELLENPVVAEEPSRIRVRLRLARPQMK